MNHRKMIAAVAGLAVAAAGTGVAVAATGAAAPKHAVIKEKSGSKMVPNRYVQDQLRFNKDVYTVKSGGTVTLVDNVVDDGPHTITVVRKKDLPRNAKEMNHCSICNQLGQAHGFDPNSDGPPKFQFLENGVGSQTAPKFDRPGDSALAGPNKGDSVSVPVTAKAGTTLHLMCLVHPWMQAKVNVVK